MSKRCASQKNHSRNVSPEEMKVYISILLATGCITPKNIRMLWEVKLDVHNELVASAMRQNRFLEIHQYLHACDNLDLPKNDKFAKIAHFFALLNSSFLDNFKSLFSISLDVSIDEIMVPCYGRHSCKQHIHGKPIRFGYKLWSACTASGYLIQFIPYQGSKASQLPEQQSLGLGAAVVLQLLSTLPNQAIQSYLLHFDNFFTRLLLLDKLTEMGHYGTGMIRENCVEKCPLEDHKTMKKKGRGAISMQATSDIALVQWNDNNIVTMASNAYGALPTTTVNRVASIKKRTKVTVSCPQVISMYNRYMGGVDRFDENVDSQRISFRGKKWCFPLFAFGIDASCQNSWKTYQLVQKEQITYCTFRRNIMQAYLGMYKKPPSKSPVCGSSSSSQVDSMVRTDNQVDEHIRENCNQALCAHCHQRTRIRCEKCQVPLHISCWYTFHK